MKKYIALIVGLAMLITMTFIGVSCKEEAAEVVEDIVEETTEVAEEVAEEEVAEEPEAKETVTLEYISNYSPEENEMIQEKIETYFADENIKVAITRTPSDDLPTILQTRVASGDTPDFSNTWPGLAFVQVYAKEGHLIDMTDRPWTDDLVEGIKSTVSWEGKVYGLPIGMDVIGVFYRKDIFETMGLVAPTTYEEFLQLCEDIKAAGKIPIAVGGNTIWHPQFMPMYTFANNVVYSEDSKWDEKLLAGEVQFSTTAGWTKAFEMFMDLENSGYFEDNPLGVTVEQAHALFENGDALMVVDGTWSIPYFTNEDALNAYGFFAMPAPEGYQTTVPVAGGGSCLQAYVNTEHPDEVKMVFDFMASEEMVKAIAVGSRLSTFKSIEIELPENYAEIIPAMLEASYPFTNITWAKGIQEALQKGYQELLGGTNTIENMLKEVDVVATQRAEEWSK